jgi:hypothetical protein
MAKCTDFIEEEPLLQSMGHQIGVTIDRMSKCYPELTGEGIAYSWACSKISITFYLSGSREAETDSKNA